MGMGEIFSLNLKNLARRAAKYTARALLFYDRLTYPLHD